MEEIVNQIVAVLKSHILLQVEASARHVHLSQADADFLFGANYSFQIAKPLSQPGQYAYKERVDLVTEKAVLKSVAVLGPCRGKTQVEISMTDAKMLGITPPVRLSGDISKTPGITLRVHQKELRLTHGVIVAKRHIHLTPQTAKRMQVTDGETVRLKVFGKRPLLFDDTTVRVSNAFSDRVHIDFDEANACGFQPTTTALIIKND